MLLQSSRSLCLLLHRFSTHIDFRLSVFESANFDSDPLGTVYNLDRLLEYLPRDGRIVSLTLDWTVMSGSLLFNTILDHCSQTLEHPTLMGCRKVSIKHHFVPHIVYQSSIFPLGDHYGKTQTPAPKSLYVYKARGVRQAVADRPQTLRSQRAQPIPYHARGRPRHLARPRSVSDPEVAVSP